MDTAGTVKWFDYMMRHGYIIPDRGGPDVFFDFSAVKGDLLPRQLDEGQAVEFESSQGPKTRRRTSARNLVTAPLSLR